jgi:hypothetical protein
MKKTISILLVLLSVVTILNSCKKEAADPEDAAASEPVESATAESSLEDKSDDTQLPNEDPNYEFTLLTDGTYAINRFLNHDATEVSVPDTYNGKAVTKIMKDAFKNCSNLTVVLIPNSVQEISEGAFFGCSALNSMSVPFIGKSRNESASLGHFFGQTPYAGGQQVNHRYITPDGYERQKPFYIPAGLKKVTVTDSIIKTYAFDSCAMLEELVFGDGVTEIQANAFIECEKLERIHMGSGFTTIPDECFSFLLNLKSIVIGKNVTKIGRSAFGNCESLERVTIPYKVTVIEPYAFSGCKSLKGITFECKTGWYRDYGSSSGTGMTVTDPEKNATNLTDYREYVSDRWKRK